MNGKDKCRILKDIRRQIAEKNDIEWVVSECKHKGNCKGDYHFDRRYYTAIGRNNYGCNYYAAEIHIRYRSGCYYNKTDARYRQP